MRKKSTRWLRLLLPFIAFMGFNGMVIAGSLEPGGAPAPTMRTLEELTPAWNKKLPDAERFVDALDGGAVLDKETGLVWEKSPSTATAIWDIAFSACYAEEIDNRKGWRLPTVEELASLVDNSNSPSLPTGHPFLDVQSAIYWSATTVSGSTTLAWRVGFSDGSVSGSSKTFSFHVWCVRGGP